MRISEKKNRKSDSFLCIPTLFFWALGLVGKVSLDCRIGRRQDYKQPWLGPATTGKGVVSWGQ